MYYIVTALNLMDAVMLVDVAAAVAAVSSFDVVITLMLLWVMLLLEKHKSDSMENYVNDLFDDRYYY